MLGFLFRKPIDTVLDDAESDAATGRPERLTVGLGVIRSRHGHLISQVESTFDFGAFLTAMIYVFGPLAVRLLERILARRMKGMEGYNPTPIGSGSHGGTGPGSGCGGTGSGSA